MRRVAVVLALAAVVAGCGIFRAVLETGEQAAGVMVGAAAGVVDMVASPQEEEALRSGTREEKEQAASAVAGRLGLDPTDPTVLAILLAIYGAGEARKPTFAAVARRMRKKDSATGANLAS